MFWKTLFKNIQTYPERLAFVTENNQITYQQLGQQINTFSAYIDSHFPPDQPIIVYGNKEIQMPVCFLSIALSGRTYIPIDTSSPFLRIENILHESNASVIFAVSKWDYPIVSNILTATEMTRILQETKKNILPKNNLQNPLYLLFTSGSTGIPKGIQISLENLESFLCLFSKIPAIQQTECTSVLNQAIYSFDLSVADLYFSLYIGATHYAISKEVQKDFRSLYAFIQYTQANLFVLTPSFAEYCLLDKTFCKDLLPYLHVFFFCGEPLSAKLVQKLWKRFPAVRIINAYGPTETTVAVTWAEIFQQDLSLSSLPIGSIGQNYFLQDGEIIIKGKQVGMGYLSSDISSGFYTQSNTSFFRTGDIGEEKKGKLFFIQRKDQQIKRGGHRIELAEIQQVLLKIPCITQATMLVKTKPKIKIYAFVVQNNHILLSPKSLEAKIREYLPSYMTPDQIISLDAFPLTANGKCDYNKLKEMYF